MRRTAAADEHVARRDAAAFELARDLERQQAAQAVPEQGRVTKRLELVGEARTSGSHAAPKGSSERMARPGSVADHTSTSGASASGHLR